uniref:CRAL-TRIO domain-containing protein n=1 Tax=Amphora coffeiformis TaxID=265554 RepID=A0A7S3PC38_9STRA
MKLLGDCRYSRDDIQAVLNAPVPFTKKGGEREVDLAEKLLATLNEDQMEQAAQSSYAYWLATLSDKPPTADERRKMALRECRRHIMKRTLEEATGEILESMKYRKDRRVDLMRACFEDDIEIENENDRMKIEKMKAHIRDDLGRQNGYIHGHDKEGRAILIVRSRESVAADEDAFILSCLYLMERAIASTEKYTAARQETIIVVLDFGKFSSSLSPTLTAATTVAKTLQCRYTQRLFKMVIIDPPFWMRTMYSMIKPFLSPLTTAKFIMATGDSAKHDTLSDFIDDDQAMPFMLPGGKLEGKVDLDKFLGGTPFQLSYDEK